MRYPSTERSDEVSVIQGIKVADPYRWLEEANWEVSGWDRLRRSRYISCLNDQRVEVSLQADQA